MKKERDKQRGKEREKETQRKKKRERRTELSYVKVYRLAQRNRRHVFFGDNEKRTISKLTGFFPPS